MPNPHLRRIGRTSALASAGALSLVLLSAPPAYAEKKCADGTDPATTIDNWKCQLDNLRERLEQPTPTPAPDPGEDRSDEPAKDPVKKPVKKPVAKRPKAPAVTRPAPVAAPSGDDVPAPQSAANRPYDAAVPDVTGLLPDPQVAALPPASGAPLPQARLVAQVGETPGQPGTVPLVAAAAGLAGAAAALNLSVAGRRRAARRTGS